MQKKASKKMKGGGANVSCVLLCRLMVHSMVVGAFLTLFLRRRLRDRGEGAGLIKEEERRKRRVRNKEQSRI